MIKLNFFLYVRGLTKKYRKCCYKRKLQHIYIRHLINFEIVLCTLPMVVSIASIPRTAVFFWIVNRCRVEFSLISSTSKWIYFQDGRRKKAQVARSRNMVVLMALLPYVGVK